ncbi:DNA repair protein XRCC2 [Musa troglodytarum]|uniref:DNA repair protein XRCC2 n=1 Tax=Musa troglodytarum TaxID=320322 RepID=A0A9E7JEV2_9LILI|nr:DNA repair protein XRCC2 [Musa troglodytarum]
MPDADDPRAWIHGDESAKAMLARVLTERSFLLLPPLHRLPLRAGNVVEIAGPSPSAKSQVLLQAAVHCILPREWRGLRFGGLERMVIYFDLDCRFDVLRLSQILKHRIQEVLGSTNNFGHGVQEGSHEYDDKVASMYSFDDELLLACMRRFFIGAFYWIDRASQPSPYGNCMRNIMSFQNLVETIVQEMHKFLEVQPLLVLASKACIFFAGSSTTDVQRTPTTWSSEDRNQWRTSNKEIEKLLYREYMPSAWQAFVTHRIHLQVSGWHISDYLKLHHDKQPKGSILARVPPCSKLGVLMFIKLVCFSFIALPFA